MNKSFSMEIDKTRDGYMFLKVKFMSSNSDENMSSNDLQTFFIMYENFTKNCEMKNIKFGQYFDLRTVTNITLAQFEMISKFFKKQDKYIVNYCLGSCLQVNGNFVKRMFSVFLKFYTPVKPITTVATYEDACTFMDDCRDNKYEDSAIINNTE